MTNPFHLMMNCIIVDDDEMSRTAMKHLVSRVQFLNLIEICESANEALNVLNTKKVDLMLLDIEMPEMTGLELIKSLKSAPLIILATSKKEYALEAFDHNVIDYLLKPIEISRFFKAINKAKEIFDRSQNNMNFIYTDYVFIKFDSQLIKININDIVWIEALGDYITIHTSEKKYTIHSTMKSIEGKLSPEKFIRVHRSFVVSIDKITSVDDNVIAIGKQIIPVGAVYKENLTKRLHLL